MTPLSTVTERRMWKRIGHIMKMTDESLPGAAFLLTPRGKRGIGRPKETRRRTAEEIQDTFKKTTKDR